MTILYHYTQLPDKTKGIIKDILIKKQMKYELWRTIEQWISFLKLNNRYTDKVCNELFVMTITENNE